MPTQYTGRVTLISSVVLLALWAIFPTFKLSKPDLRPGIDMVGGTSLLYEIQAPEGGVVPQDLAVRVMNVLKKRVDPDGVKNLIWRPQGNRRIEIQMPLSGDSGQAQSIRDAFLKAQGDLEGTNVRVGEVQNAVETLKGDERKNKLNALAGDSDDRAKLFGSLASFWDQIQDARTRKDADAQAKAENTYEELRNHIGDQNLSTAELQAVVETPEAQRPAKLAAEKAKYANFPSRLKAIDEFADKYSAYVKVKGTIDSAAELKRQLKGSGVLEFHITAVPPSQLRDPSSVSNISEDEFSSYVKRLNNDGPGGRTGDKFKWFVVDKADEFHGSSRVYNDKNYVLAGVTPDTQLVNGPGIPAWSLKNAQRGNDQSGHLIVQFQFDHQGGALFGDLTGKNLHKQLGIVLDGRMISAPNLNERITESGQISGGANGFSEDETAYLVSTLDAGALPARLSDVPISEVTVGPQLGADNLKAGLYACIFSLVVVLVFLVFYYYLAGIVAFIAVCINLVIILGVMSMLNATFTLPGVAGIVLTVGAAVDANVLVFERLREEQHRGLSLKMALRNAYGSAWSAILDSNMTTLITSFMLYVMGTEEVKGFGITLLIGLISSLFTSLYVTKTIFGLMIEYGGITRLGSFPLSFPWWERLLRPSIDWMAKIWWFVGISAVVTVVGIGSLVYYRHQLLDIEFASGTSVQFDLKQPMEIEDVRKLIPQDDPVLPAPSVQSVGTDKKSYDFITVNPDATKVKPAIIKIFGDKLQLERPSTFDYVDADSADLVGKTLIPLTSDKLDDLKKAAGFLPADWGNYRNGAAVVLKNLSPALSADDIKERLNRQRVQPVVASEQHQAELPADFVVVVPPGVKSTEPSDVAVVMLADEKSAYDHDAGLWRDNLAGPMWKLAGNAINKPAELSKVVNFDPQIAGQTQQDATIAMVVSIALILLYIWLRFGDFKFGTATVIAMLHDTLLVFGAIGLAHLLAGTFIGKALLFEPFRLNLTLVAAILTVMSYSMIDTIVVFDRIRENRGKFGHLDRQVVNDSVNQTLSRTLLTAGTNLVTVLFMYLFGGAGIHGFTFVLLFGILVGTYSSIAIAAPILLIGNKVPQSTPKRTSLVGPPAVGA